MKSSPSEILILRGLSADFTEKMIFEKIQELGYTPEYVRIPKDNLTKLPKGLALVRFSSIESATDFFKNHTTIDIKDHSLWLEFGFEHTDDDWTCKTCRTINFKHREVCFKCSRPKIGYPKSLKNDGRDDISVAKTRFVLIRNLEDHLTAEKVYDKIFLFENNLKRAWLLINRESKQSQNFGFLEFFSEQAAESFIDRQFNLNIPLKFETNEISLSFGRDLSLLSQSFSGAINGKITYWDNDLEFSEYPAYVMIIPETITKFESSQNSGINGKRTALNVFPLLSLTTVPPKKLQLQLKNWTEKAKASDAIDGNSSKTGSNYFVPENSLTNSKSKFVDFNFLCCLLCETKFNSESELTDHVQNSLSHSEKFDEYWKNSVNNDDLDLYHDRAAERRDAFGIDEEKVKKIQEECSVSLSKQQITQEIRTNQTVEPPPIADDSIGAKLLKKMGWKDGKGLGKDSSGIVEPIKAKTSERPGAGIGAANLISADSIKSKSYSDKVRNNRLKRYEE